MLFVILGAKFHLESKGGVLEGRGGKKNTTTTNAEKTQIAIVIIIIITVVLITHAASIRMKYGLI